MKRKPVAKTRSDPGAFSGDAQVDAALLELGNILAEIARNKKQRNDLSSDDAHMNHQEERSDESTSTVST